MKPFVKIGRYRINVASINAITTVKGGAVVYTAAIMQNGKPLIFTLKDEDAARVEKALDPFTTVLHPG